MTPEKSCRGRGDRSSHRPVHLKGTRTHAGICTAPKNRPRFLANQVWEFPNGEAAESQDRYDPGRRASPTGNTRSPSWSKGWGRLQEGRGRPLLTEPWVG